MESIGEVIWTIAYRFPVGFALGVTFGYIGGIWGLFGQNYELDLSKWGL